jgi:apolipoprotein N-acyltransferase
MAQRRPRSLLVGLATVGAGLLVAASLPPWGFWPAAWIGFAVLDRLVGTSDGRRRFARGWLFGLGWFAPGMWWMWFLTPPGYIAAVAVFACFTGAACAVVPPSPWRRLALPGALTLSEAVRFTFPLGGVPLASVAVGQAGGPLAPVVRLGGSLLLTAVTIGIGMAISAAFERHRLVATIGASAVVVLTAISYVAPAGHSVRTIVVAAVQGGGPQGTHAIDTDPRVVVQRALAETATLEPGADLVVWPENVIDLATFANSPDARGDGRGRPPECTVRHRHHQKTPPRHFTNAQVVVMPNGDIMSLRQGETSPLRRVHPAARDPPRHRRADQSRAYRRRRRPRPRSARCPRRRPRRRRDLVGGVLRRPRP